MKKPLIAIEKCKVCGLCTGACPKKILELSSAFNKQGVNYPVCKEESSCIGCKFCAMICPDCVIEIVETDGEA